jgi:hypothetical protein
MGQRVLHHAKKTTKYKILYFAYYSNTHLGVCQFHPHRTSTNAVFNQILFIEIQGISTSGGGRMWAMHLSNEGGNSKSKR